MFAPYHRFAACQDLEEIVHRFQGNGVIDNTVKSAFDNYHSAMMFKLRSARYHLDQLKGIVSAASLQDAGNPELLLKINIAVDGFFYCCGGALDIVAREVLSYYGLTLPAKVYFKTARDLIVQADANDSLLPKFADPAWKAHFIGYRNAATHEQMIANVVQFEVAMVGASQVTRLICKLPDDPRAAIAARTYRRNREAVDYCKEHFERILRLINQIYSELVRRAEAKGRLPLTP